MALEDPGDTVDFVIAFAGTQLEKDGHSNAWSLFRPS